MAYIVTSPCIGVKDAACTKVCPCDCFYDAGEMLVIDPEHCIDCGMCVPECPVGAIFSEAEVPPEDAAFIERNAAFFNGKTEQELEGVRRKS